MKNIKLIKILGIGATIIGAGASLIASWASEKQQEATIAEKVAEEVKRYLEPLATLNDSFNENAGE